MINYTRIKRLVLLLVFTLLILNNKVQAASAITYGQTVSGSISVAAEKDEYTFNGISGERVTIRFAKTSGTYSPYAQLYNPAGGLVTSSSSGEITVSLTSTGIFKIIIADYNNTGIGDYSLSIQRINNPVGAVTLSFGEAVSGNIDSFSKIVAYSFSANANDIITVRSAVVTQTAGYFDVNVELYDSTGTLLISTSSGSLNKKVLTTGNYYLLVTDAGRNGTGTYSLSSQRVNNPAGAIALSFGEAVSGSIDSFSKIVAYSFSANANDTITVRSAVVTKITTYFDVNVELYDSAGTLQISASSGSLTKKVSTTGNYYLLVTDAGRNGTGTYSLSSQRVNNPAGAIALSFGEAVSGNIDSFSKIVAYSFSANANDIITVRSAVVTQTAGYFDVNVELYDSTGTLQASASNGSLNKKVLTTGNYYLLVTDAGRNGTGTYSLSSQRVNNPAGAIALSFGEAVSGNIDSFSKIVAYSFLANANDTITVRSAVVTKTSVYFDVNVELYDSTGTLQTSTNSGALTKKVSTTGNYYLLVTDSGRDGTGTYSLSSQRINNPSGVIALSFGQAVSGSIDSFSKIVAYSFSANANDTITVRSAVVTKITTYFDVNVELYDSAGTLQISTSNGSLNKKVLTTGSYYLLITDSARDGTGTYSLSSQRVNNPAGAIALSFGQAVSGTIDSFSKIVTYSFSANANDKILIPFVKLNQLSGYFEPYLELYDSAGTKVSYASNGRMEYTVIAAGAYCLLITDSSRDGTGTFECSLQCANNPADAVAISYDAIIQDSLDTVTRLKAYKITAQAQDKITFCSLVKGDLVNLGLYVELFNTSGTRLVYGYGSLKYTFTVSGTFYIFVSDSGYDCTGIYRFTVVKSDVSCVNLDISEPQVILLTPKSAEVVENNSSYGISWTSSDNVGVTWQEIQLSTDSGVTYPVSIVTDLAGNVSSYNWSVPATLSSLQARVKIIARDAKGNEGFDSGKGDFIIVNTALPAEAVNVMYQYDKQSRLIQSNDGSSNVTYTYDQVDNRLNLNKN